MWRSCQNSVFHTAALFCISVSCIDSLDWKGIDAGQITKNVLSKVQSGSIILFHNAAKHTPEALPGIIESLQKQGYKIVPISKLIYRENYTIDRAGTQHSTVVSGAPQSPSAASGRSSPASSAA